MLKKCVAFLLMFLTLNLVAGPIVNAQATGDAATAKVKAKVAKIGRGKKVVVVRRDETKLRGVLNVIDADYFSLTDKKTGAETRFAYSEVKKVNRPGLSTGAKIAIIAGIAVPVIIGLSLLRIRICNESAC
jgi:hypothetical protein